MPSLQYSVLLLPDMSDKKSPPLKQERPLFVRTPQSDSKSFLKRKLISPNSPPQTDDDDKKTTPKRKKPNLNSEASPTPGSFPQAKPSGGITSPRTGPLSERQQMLILMKETSQDCTTKPVSPTPTVIGPKRTPGDKKVHKRNERGETPLHLAAIRGDAKTTKRLIKAGADVNVADFAGWTALHEACNSGWLNVARQLLKAGANVNVQGFENDTPLHDASGNGYSKIVELLLKNGANPLQPNIHGKTPVDVAHSQDIVKLLRKEIIASSSDSSSVDDIRSPTSPESNSSTCMKEDDRNLDIEELTSKLPKSEGGSGPSSRKVLIPQSPDKLASPRLIFKFQREQTEEMDDKVKDPHYTTYSVKLETSENEKIFPSLDSPVSSVDSDLYDPQLDNGPKNRIHSDNVESTLNVMENSSKFKVTAPVSDVDIKSFEKLSNLEPDNSESSGSKYHLKMMETQPFSPLKSFDDFSDGDSKDSFKGILIEKGRIEKSLEEQHTHIPLKDSNNHTDNTVVQSSNMNSGEKIKSLSEDISDEAHDKNHSFSVCSTADRTRLSNTLRRNSCGSVVSGNHSNSSLTFSANIGSSSGNDNMSVSSGLKWELRSTTSPKSEDGSNHSSKSDSACISVSSPGRSSERIALKLEKDLKDSRGDQNRLTLEKDSKDKDRGDHNRLSVDNKDKDRGDHSRPSSPKVPPLKIIIPPKTGSSSSSDCDSLNVHTSKHALPYVLNPTQEQALGMTLSNENASNSLLLPVTQETSQTLSSNPDISRQSSQDGTTSPSVKDSEKFTVMETDENGESNKTDNLNVNKKDIDESNVKSEETDNKVKEKENKEKEEENTQRSTRTLRSHTQAKQQQQQQNKDKQETQTSQQKQDKTGNESTQNDDTGSTSKQSKSEDEEMHIHPRKRKLRPKPESTAQAQQDQQQQQHQAQPPLPNVSYEIPPNPFELFLTMRRQIACHRSSLTVVQPKAPQGFKDYLMVRSTYVLQGNNASTLSVPTLSPPNSVTGSMRDLFIEQEKARYKLRLQHLTEREKLVLAKEQEIIREHGRAARALANQSQPLSVCTVLREDEIYNNMDYEQDEKEKNTRSRYNGRQFLSWIKDVDDKYDKIKECLLLRHHHEAESLFAVQKMEWEWKLKDLKLCDHKTVPIIDELHVPMVHVNDDFELLPS